MIPHVNHLASASFWAKALHILLSFYPHNKLGRVLQQVSLSPPFYRWETEAYGYYHLLRNLVTRFTKLLDIPFAAVHGTELWVLSILWFFPIVWTWASCYAYLSLFLLCDEANLPGELMWLLNVTPCVQSSLLRSVAHVLSTPVLLMAAMIRKLSKSGLPFSFRFLTIHFFKSFN